MYIEMLIIAVIVFYIFIVNNKISTTGMFGSDSKLTGILKEKDYDFLLMLNMVIEYMIQMKYL